MGSVCTTRRSAGLVLAAVATAALSAGGGRTTQPQAPKPLQAQAAPRDVKAAQSATGVIRGRVVAADTGEPLRRARLVLSAPALAKPRFATTDAQGRYEFTALPAGRYTLAASKTLYVPLQFGQQRAFETGRPVELTDKQVLEAIDFQLPRGAVITGRIVDDTGEPVVGATVAVMRPRFVDGARRLTRVGRAVETNDRGEYRLFDLAPGSYYVGTFSALLGDSLPYGSSYFPGTANPDEAQRVTVNTGQVLTGIDLALQPVMLVTLAGTLLDAARGVPLAHATVRAYSAGGSVSISGVVRPDGTFTIANVPPGEYSLIAAGSDPESSRSLTGILPVTVGGGDIGGLAIAAVAGGRASGRVVFEGAAKPPVSPSSLTVLSEVARPVGLSTGRIGTIKGDWTFELTSQFGPRLFRLSRAPEGWALKAVRLGGRDVTDAPIVFTGNEDIAGIQIVLTNRTTSVSGRVTDDRGRDVKDFAIVAFAEDAARWTWQSRFVATARPDLEGQFTITRLPPGTYLIVALEYLDEGDTSDPKFLESLRATAQRVTLEEGASKKVEVKLTGVGG